MDEITVLDYSEQFGSIIGILRGLADFFSEKDSSQEFLTSLHEISVRLAFCSSALELICGILAFFLVVLLCYLIYKFFRIFF